MTDLALEQLQDALDFLKRVNRVELAATVPPQIDYPSIVAFAATQGIALDARAVAEAFRLLIQARLVASRSRDIGT